VSEAYAGEGVAKRNTNRISEANKHTTKQQKTATCEALDKADTLDEIIAGSG
jgi:hypothetical protein